MLTWFRSTFDKGYRKEFHFVPAASAAYDELCKKYGGDYVFRGDGSADNVILTKIINLCTANGNDVIRLHGGTFVWAAVVSSSKAGLTITGASDNPNAAVVDCAAGNVAAFSLTGANCTLKNFTILEDDNGTTDCITSTGAGCVFDNLVIQGGNIASTTGTMVITGSYNTVRNCRLHLIRKGIIVGGHYTHVLNNFVQGSDGTAGNFGITLTGAASRLGQFVSGNTVFMSGSTNPKAVVVAANADVAIVTNNALLGAGDQLEAQSDTYGAANLDVSATIVSTPVWVAE